MDETRSSATSLRVYKTMRCHIKRCIIHSGLLWEPPIPIQCIHVGRVQ